MADRPEICEEHEWTDPGGDDIYCIQCGNPQAIVEYIADLETACAAIIGFTENPDSKPVDREWILKTALKGFDCTTFKEYWEKVSGRGVKQLSPYRGRIETILDEHEPSKDRPVEAMEAVVEASKMVMLLIEHDTGLPETAANGNVGPSGYPDEGVVRATKIIAKLEKALANLEATDAK